EYFPLVGVELRQLLLARGFHSLQAVAVAAHLSLVCEMGSDIVLLAGEGSPQGRDKLMHLGLLQHPSPRSIQQFQRVRVTDQQRFGLVVGGSVPVQDPLSCGLQLLLYTVELMLVHSLRLLITKWSVASKGTNLSR